MKKSKFIVKLLIFILFAFMIIPGTVYSTSVAVNEKAYYEEGITYAALNDYHSALSSFQKAINQADSMDWIDYCQAMIFLENADDYELLGYIPYAKSEVEKAEELFALLSAGEYAFNDSAKLDQYCKARVYEYSGMLQTAENMFAELRNIRDSRDRYARLRSGYTIKPVQPMTTPVPTHNMLNALISKRVTIYDGPGTAYAVNKQIELQADTKVRVCVKEGDYYLIQATANEVRFRVWIHSTRLYNIESGNVLTLEHKFSNLRTTGRVMQDVYPAYGPGNGYAKHDELLRIGTVITICDYEYFYAMVEYLNANGQMVRAWIPTDCIS